MVKRQDIENVMILQHVNVNSLGTVNASTSKREKQSHLAPTWESCAPIAHQIDAVRQKRIKKNDCFETNDYLCLAHLKPAWEKFRGTLRRDATDISILEMLR